MSKFGNKGRHRGGGQNRNYRVGAQAKETLEEISENSPVLQSFRQYARELDKKHDKFESLVKLSRDITIESKRIIFLLHSMNSESKKASILNEAETRLEALVSKNWKLVAKELHNEDPYLYHKAFSPGMQEFIEAYGFYSYLKDKQILHWDHYQQKLNYTSSNAPDDKSSPEEPNITLDKEPIKLSTIIIPVDFLLGLADVTGELMRKCINSLGEGNTEGCFETCNFVRNLYSGFLSIGWFGNREMSNKAITLRHSLLKMEMVCYNIHVRGIEAFKYVLLDVDGHKNYAADDDEGFFG